LDLEALAAKGILPACPAVLTSLIRATQNPETTTAELAEILSADQSLTIKLLRLVNSAFYGLPRTIRSVEEAAFRLGFRELWALAVAVKVDDLYQKADNLWGKDVEGLWQHSLKTGVIGRLLCGRLPGTKSEESFTAGVIHDIGKLVFCVLDGKRYVEISDFGHRCGPRLCEAERAVWNMDHAKLGADLVRRWQLPEALALTIEHHHDPAWRGRIDPNAGLLCAADALAHAAKSLGLNAGEPHLPEALKEGPLVRADFSDELLAPEVAAAFRLDAGECVRIITEAMRRFDEMVALFR
jgi:putative nucleotidyltransferase with HDIG domain